MENTANVPVIDISSIISITNSGKDALTKVGSEIISAFESVGFMYVKNHGIKEEGIDDILRVSRDFFRLSPLNKAKHLKPADSNHGWMEPERESLNPGRPPDLKEAFNFTPDSQRKHPLLWPEEVDGFQAAFQSFWSQCTHVTLAVLDAMSIGLEQEQDFLSVRHRKLGMLGNASTLRSMYYPGLNEGFVPKDKQVRCGEHSDYGSITLLFQDDIGGLEVQTKSGDFIPVPPLEGAIVVNIGDLMQRWTSDSLIAARHRVLIPNNGRHKTRQSVAFFVQPDNDVTIQCMETRKGTRYPPVNALDYLLSKFTSTYQDNTAS